MQVSLVQKLAGVLQNSGLEKLKFLVKFFSKVQVGIAKKGLWHCCFRMKYSVLLYMKSCRALRDLEPFEQFKQREKHPWRSVTFSKVADFSNFRITEFNFTKKNSVFLGNFVIIS